MEHMDYLQNLQNRFDHFEEIVDDYLGRERRQYKMQPRINMDKWDDDDFVYRFRLEKRTVATRLILIEDSLKYRAEQRRSRHITSLTQLLIALRFYALGSMEVAIADFAGVCVASVSRIIKRVSLALAMKSVDLIQMPSTQNDLLVAAKEFYDIAKFPRTIGSIDCTHIRIQSPGGNEPEVFCNRKGWFSINMQTVSSADLKIISLMCRWPGSTHDQTIFNGSRIKYRFESGHFGNFILVGDCGYRNTMYLATPFLEASDEVERLYNESQIRTRNVVERSYGVLKHRFPVLAYGIRLKLETVREVIVACCVLHNIALDERYFLPRAEIIGFDEMLQRTAEVNFEEPLEQPGRNERNVRMNFVSQYFRSVLAETL